jgi:hypothetical protein
LLTGLNLNGALVHIREQPWLKEKLLGLLLWDWNSPRILRGDDGCLCLAGPTPLIQGL